MTDDVRSKLMSLTIGQIVDGKFRVVRLMGEGGMGAVYEGEHTRIGRRVAIKVMHAHLSREREFIQRFEREARVANRVSSPYLADVLDLGDLPTGERFIVMEYLDGESLDARLKRVEKMTPHDVLRWAFQLLDGLAKVHDAAIVHRDLNPHNIYLVKRPGGDAVKIIDFGLAKFQAEPPSDAPPVTRPGSVLGTPHYMAPEQARGQVAEIDARSDLYAVGVVFYRAITGQLPFRSQSYADLAMQINFETPTSPHELVPGLDKDFSAIVQKAMAREKKARYGSARDMLAALAKWAGLPVVSDIALDTTSPSAVMAAPPSTGTDDADAEK